MWIGPRYVSRVMLGAAAVGVLVVVAALLVALGILPPSSSDGTTTAPQSSAPPASPSGDTATDPAADPAATPPNPAAGSSSSPAVPPVASAPAAPALSGADDPRTVTAKLAMRLLTQTPELLDGSLGLLDALTAADAQADGLVEAAASLPSRPTALNTSLVAWVRPPDGNGDSGPGAGLSLVVRFDGEFCQLFLPSPDSDLDTMKVSAFPDLPAATAATTCEPSQGVPASPVSATPAPSAPASAAPQPSPSAVSSGTSAP